MGESQELFASVNYIKNKIDTMEKIELLQLRSNKALREEYISMLQSDILLLKVYKEVDGKKSQKEIAATLNTAESSVSAKITKLFNYGLVEIKEISSNRRIYRHTIAEQAFKLTKL